MNNTQKALEIAEDYYCVYNVAVGEHHIERCISKSECYHSAKAMAEWKDQQFIKFLENRMGDEISVKMIEEFKEIVNG